MGEESPATPEQTVDALVTEAIAEGYLPLDELRSIGVEFFCDDFPQFSVEQAREFVNERMSESIAAHAESQATWSHPNDCDRLDDAFDELLQRGILAIKAPCCHSCAMGFLVDRAADAKRAGLGVRGYTYFHDQELQDVLRSSSSIGLSYGRFDSDHKVGMRKIGIEVADTLRAHGFKTPWNGNVSRCIEIQIDWQRRRDDDGEPLFLSPAPEVAAVLEAHGPAAGAVNWSPTPALREAVRSYILRLLANIDEPCAEWRRWTDESVDSASDAVAQMVRWWTRVSPDHLLIQRVA